MKGRARSPRLWAVRSLLGGVEPCCFSSMELYQDPNDAVEVLNLVVGITSASVRKPSSTLNANKLQFYVGSGRASREPVTMSCNRDYPDRSSLGPRAIAEARKRVGDAAVDAAERLVLERRAAAAAAASTPAAPPTINHLMLTQQLAAAVRAAQLRAETTERAAARAEAEATAAYLAAVAEPLATRQAAWDEVAEAKEAQARHCKQQRTAAPEAPAPAEPAWRRRPYAAYSTVEYWRQYEGEIWNRAAPRAPQRQTQAAGGQAAATP